MTPLTAFPTKIAYVLVDHGGKIQLTGENEQSAVLKKIPANLKRRRKEIDLDAKHGNLLQQKLIAGSYHRALATEKKPA